MTHDPARKSWVETANHAASDFPIQNLPYCTFSRGNEPRRAGVAIGDQIFDLAATVELGLLEEWAAAIRACTSIGLNPLMMLDGTSLTALRHRLCDLLDAAQNGAAEQRNRVLVALCDASLHLPVAIGGFTDFFTSIYHTERTGRVFRPANPVPPNFRYMPLAYNSRASSVRVSGEKVRRPLGQRRRDNGDVHFGPSEGLDFELELGAFIGKSNDLGDPIRIDAAGGHIFGYCLLNDWSARDVQRWESFPLGPFLAKSLSTSISPFVVTAEALVPFRTRASKRPYGDPAPLPYLLSESDQQSGGIDLTMDAYIQTGQMRARGEMPLRVTRTNFKEMYWTVAQMIAHHTSNGCNLCVGDLIGSGTASGSDDDNRACLAEITGGGNAIPFPNGEKRTWLEDGDTVIFRARAERDGFVPIGFGECSGRIAPADHEAN